MLNCNILKKGTHSQGIDVNMSILKTAKSSPLDCSLKKKNTFDLSQNITMSMESREIEMVTYMTRANSNSFKKSQQHKCSSRKGTSTLKETTNAHNNNEKDTRRNKSESTKGSMSDRLTRNCGIENVSNKHSGNCKDVGNKKDERTKNKKTKSSTIGHQEIGDKTTISHKHMMEIYHATKKNVTLKHLIM